MKLLVRIAVTILILQLTAAIAYPQLPDGFVDELITDEISTPVGIIFFDTEKAFIWTQDGLVYLLDHGAVRDTPVLDLSLEVSGTADHGMLGLALDPDFTGNGLIYLSYVVDPHYLRYFGTPRYDPDLPETWDATIGRVTRYQLNTESFTEVIEDSRLILLGQEISNGIPVLAPAHGVGGLTFGTDGTLLVGTGDGTTWVGHHTGGENYLEFGFDSLGKALGIIQAYEDVGSYRAQMVESLSGKILRIDPISGSGLPSNPFFDHDNPDAPRSKVWALGLRTPFRITVRPGSGSADPSEGRPGFIYIGDVGSNQFEELNICHEAGMNFGWPSYEGHFRNEGFAKQNVEVPLTQDLLPCSASIEFNDILIADNRQHRYHWANPCGNAEDLSTILPTFVHTAPQISYGNTVNNPVTTYLTDFDEQGEATAKFIDIGLPFDGISSVAGVFYEGSIFPREYHGAYFHGDFGGWLRLMNFDTHDGQDEFHSILPFATMTRSIVHLHYNPFDESIYYVVLDYSDRPNLYQIRQISYTDNPRPVAVINMDTSFGYTPLAVRLNAESSYDPAFEEITFLWDIDGESYHFKDSTILFESATAGPTNKKVTLIVKDASGLVDSTVRIVSLNNTPPEVDITSIPDDYRYPLNQDAFLLELQADVTDQEQADSLQYHWEIKLSHNDHFHVEFSDNRPQTSVSLPALPSTSLDSHAYVIYLEVTDPLGLIGFDAIEINPDFLSSTSFVEPVQQFFLYPNPSFEVLNIQLRENTRMPKSWLITDLLGRALKEGDFQTSPLQINVFDFAPGSYVLYFSDREKIFNPLRFVKW